MDPNSLGASNFAHYPPEARAFAEKNLLVLRQIPLPLLSIVLAQVIEYDYRFPAEREMLDRQFRALAATDAKSLSEIMDPFAALQLPEDLTKSDWVNQPRRFNEQLSALLWSTHQLDAYRDAGHKYEEKLATALSGEVPATPRFAIVVVGSGVAQTDRVLFRNLRPLGAIFAVHPAGALDTLVAFVNDRAYAHPGSYAHWYIDGGPLHPSCGEAQGITVMSYEELAPYAFKELNLMNEYAEHSPAESPMGAEEMQTFMASLGPGDLGLARRQDDAVLRHFESSIFTGGAGTQIYSTTFVQWTAREALRRAQPVTLFARFAPRQKPAAMETLLKRNPLTQEKDPQGSLVDADMGAYYTWINQMRLVGAEQSRFLVWFEDHELAVAISPSLARGTSAASPATMQQVLRWMDSA